MPWFAMLGPSVLVVQLHSAIVCQMNWWFGAGVEEPSEAVFRGSAWSQLPACGLLWGWGYGHLRTVGFQDVAGDFGSRGLGDFTHWGSLGPVKEALP